jgi:hypothetical protein
LDGSPPEHWLNSSISLLLKFSQVFEHVSLEFDDEDDATGDDDETRPIKRSKKQSTSGKKTAAKRQSVSCPIIPSLRLLITTLFFRLATTYSSSGKAADKSASVTPRPAIESEQDDSDFSGGGRKPGKRRRAAAIKSDGEEPSLLRISARSGKAQNYNEDDRYLGMISDSEDEQIAAYANQPTVAIGGGDPITTS